MRPGTRSVALAIATLAAAACSNGEESGSVVLDLAHRAPDRSASQPGVVEARADRGLAPLDREGWDRFAETVGGRTAVWTAARHVVLALPSVRANDRTIELEVVGRAPDAPVAVTASLGGRTLGEAIVDAVPCTLEFPAPRELWHGGSLELTLEIGATVFVDRPPRDGGRADRGIAVARVAYAGVEVVEVDAQGLRLDPGATVVHAVEGTGAIALHGRASAPCSGALVVEPVRLDAASGAFEPAGDPVEVRVRAGAETGIDVGLDADGPGPHGVRLAWRPDGERTDAVRIDELVAERSKERASPPIVFVSIDTLAANDLRLYGYDRDTSTRLEELARDGVVFTDCRANAPWTVPSYLAQFTGLLPPCHRVEADAQNALKAWDQRILSRARWSLAELLRASGLTTVAVVDNPWLRNVRGFERGFDGFDGEPASRPPTDRDGGARLVFAKALQRLDAHPDETPFLFLQVVDVHGPYLPGPGFRGRYGSEEECADDRIFPVVQDAVTVAHAVARYVAGSLGEAFAHAAEVSGRRLVATYDEGVFEVDSVLGEFLDGLRERGLYDDALIVVSADHGESLLADDFLFSHAFPTEQVLRVPLVVKLPHSRNAGRVVDEPVQLVDLYSTLAELAGVDTTDRGLHGISLVPWLEDEPPALRERPITAFDGAFDTRSIVLGGWKLVVQDLARTTPAAMLSQESARDAWRRFDERVRLLDQDPDLAPERAARAWAVDAPPLLERYPFAFEAIESLRAFAETGPQLVRLFDLASDPHERVDVAASNPNVARMLEERLEEIRASCRALRPRHVRGEERASAEDADLLRQLGYVGEE
ncbi:MAG: sulfatase-like hydrolase/transferase [Planctomycetota bacterium]